MGQGMACCFFGGYGPKDRDLFFHYQRVGEALAQAMLHEWGIPHVNLWGTNPDADGDHVFQTNPNMRSRCSHSMAREAVTLTKAAYQMMMEYP